MAGKSREELQDVSRENIEYIFDYMKSKLQVVNTAAVSAKSFDTDQYEELLDLYEFLCMKESFSMSEMQSIVSELGKLRKKS
ncbi:DUF1128 domain-containing protein [Bacillus horti]|uniref:Uncharacterized protein YfkK (UPF0435 family) n=1 Tax=Caldalkalibacillus horti TaxID=77523 RepID=A0ABT9W3H3_9BACI|nr:DUF1128 domain-containing protein [Bacillus horti]MDQ0167800.1 uncharacterized protein YfkK (UPF0435 family) [Bacillus horti]